MTEPSHDAQQCTVHMVLGFIPILKVRKSAPSSDHSWGWGRWRYARFGDLVVINALLMQTWRK